MATGRRARRAVVLSLVASVASGYVQLRALDEQLVIATRTREAYGESVRLFELQHQHGLKSRMTVEQARTQYETAAAVVPQIEAQIARTENALSVLLGRNPGEIPRGRSIVELALPPVPAGLPSAVLEQRPDVRQAEQSLVAANARIGAAKALYFPTISLTGRNIDGKPIKHKIISADCGRASFEYVRKLIELALAKEIDATVTGPISKEAINLAGFHYSGHTEIYADVTTYQRLCHDAGPQ